MVPSSIGQDERFSFSKEEFDSPRDYQFKSVICTAKCYFRGTVAEGVTTRPGQSLYET